MVITLKKLIAERGRAKAKHGQRCPYCGILLQETITGKRRAPDGDACSDCYYEELGEGVERHPIVSGRVRRG